MRLQCCVCKKMREKDGWFAPSPVALHDDAISHGYCPSCATDAFRHLREYDRHNLPAYVAKPGRLIDSLIDPDAS